MSPPTDPSELDAALARMRIAVLAASFRKLRYHVAPDELAMLLSDKKSNAQAFDHIESRQPFFTKLRIRWTRFRRDRNR